MINHAVLKTSKHGSFQVSQLCQSIAICEAVKGDRYKWGNATEDKPAFLVYLGCKWSEVAEQIRIINNTLGCYVCEVRKAKYLKDFEAEIKIRGVQRESNDKAYGLDYLLIRENNFDPIEEDEYSYYVTRHTPLW